MALGQDTSSAIVQHWALHALASIAETSGPVFRPFVDSCSKMALHLLLTVPSSNVEVHRSVGRCCAALVIVFGPELQGAQLVQSSNVQQLVSFRLIQSIQLTNVGFDRQYGQYHIRTIFVAVRLCSSTAAQQPRCAGGSHHVSTAASHVRSTSRQFEHPRTGSMRKYPLLIFIRNRPEFVVIFYFFLFIFYFLQRSISSNHLGLRRAAVSCLRQLVQREAREVCQHAATYTSDSGTIPLFNGSEQGLASALFILLDSETDAMLQRHIRDTITGLLTSLAEQQLSGWLNLCKEVLTVSAESTPTTVEQRRVQSPSGYPLKAAGSETMDADGALDDDEEEFRAGVEQASATSRGRPSGLKVYPQNPSHLFIDCFQFFFFQFIDKLYH